MILCISKRVWGNQVTTPSYNKKNKKHLYMLDFQPGSSSYSEHKSWAQALEVDSPFCK